MNQIDPREVPKDQLSPLSRRFLQWKFGTAVAGIFAVLVLVNMFTGQTSITGHAVNEGVGASPYATSFVIFIFAVLIAVAAFSMIRKR